MTDRLKMNITNNKVEVFLDGKKLGLISYRISYHTATDKFTGEHSIHCILTDKDGKVYDVFHNFRLNDTTVQILGVYGKGGDN